MRWHSPTRGSVPPARFIPVAEATGLIMPLGEFVLREACRQTSAWRRDGLVSDRFVTWVNLSGQQLSSGGICDLVRDVLRAHGLPGESLGLEVTETAIVAEGAVGELARTELEELHNLGVHIAIDDFGTGFSSLAQLQRFPIDVIKIDGSFVQGAEHDVKAAAITANIVNLAQVLGLRTIAEGIESDGQLRSIRRLGCDVAQGFLFAHPVSAEELTPLFESRHSWAAPPTASRSAPAELRRVAQRASVVGEPLLGRVGRHRHAVGSFVAEPLLGRVSGVIGTPSGAGVVDATAAGAGLRVGAASGSSSDSATADTAAIVPTNATLTTRRIVRWGRVVGFSPDRRLAGFSLEARAPGRGAVRAGDLSTRHEADIVAVAGIARARIAETGEDQHDKSPAGIGWHLESKTAGNPGRPVLFDRGEAQPRRRLLRPWHGRASAGPPRLDLDRRRDDRDDGRRREPMVSLAPAGSLMTLASSGSPMSKPRPRPRRLPGCSRARRSISSGVLDDLHRAAGLDAGAGFLADDVDRDLDRDGLAGWRRAGSRRGSGNP